METFEKFETVYWIAGEDRKFDVLEGKIVDILYNGEMIIECDGVIYPNILSCCCFKHNDYGRKTALDLAKYVLDVRIKDYRAEIVALERVIAETIGDSLDDQYEKLKRVAIKDRLEGQLNALLKLRDENNVKL